MAVFPLDQTGAEIHAEDQNGGHDEKEREHARRQITSRPSPQCTGIDDRALHEGDALEFDFSALASERGGRLRIVGNLPYNISTPLLFHLLRHAAAIADLTVMLQREVVARIAAAPGNRDYGRLSVMLAPQLQAERLFDVALRATAALISPPYGYVSPALTKARSGSFSKFCRRA